MKVRNLQNLQNTSLPGVPMGSHGFRWVSMGSHGFPYFPQIPRMHQIVLEASFRGHRWSSGSSSPRCCPKRWWLRPSRRGSHPFEMPMDPTSRETGDLWWFHVMFIIRLFWTADTLDSYDPNGINILCQTAPNSMNDRYFCRTRHQEQDWRFLQQCPGNGNPLLLTARELRPSWAEAAELRKALVAKSEV